MQMDAYSLPQELALQLEEPGEYVYDYGSHGQLERISRVLWTASTAQPPRPLAAGGRPPELHLPDGSTVTYEWDDEVRGGARA